MITLTARWADWTWKLDGKEAEIVHPTPGRDRPLVITCQSPHTAAVMTGVLTRLGLSVEQEISPALEEDPRDARIGAEHSYKGEEFHS